MANAPIRNTKLLQEAYAKGYAKARWDLHEQHVDFPAGQGPSNIAALQQQRYNSGGVDHGDPSFGMPKGPGLGLANQQYGKGGDNFWPNLPVGDWPENLIMDGGVGQNLMDWFMWFANAIGSGDIPRMSSMPPQFDWDAMGYPPVVSAAFNELTNFFPPGTDWTSGDYNSTGVNDILGAWGSGGYGPGPGPGNRNGRRGGNNGYPGPSAPYNPGGGGYGGGNY